MKQAKKIFDLCDDCRRNYQQLEFNEHARLNCNTLPYGTILWEDEHLPVFPAFECHRIACKVTINNLISARSFYWADRNIPENYAEFWQTAKEKIPSWPGFRRLQLSDEEQKQLEACETQVVLFFDGLFRTSKGNVTINADEGGDIKFKAKIDLPKE